MPPKIGKTEFTLQNVQVKLGDNFVPLGKIETAEAITAETEVPAETIGLDMTGFAIGGTETLTMELNIKNPLLLKLTLLGIPVVNIIMCKNCKYHSPCGFCEMLYKRYGHDPAYMKSPDDFFCGYGELRQKESEE